MELRISFPVRDVCATLITRKSDVYKWVIDVRQKLKENGIRFRKTVPHVWFMDINNDDKYEMDTRDKVFTALNKILIDVDKSRFGFDEHNQFVLKIQPYDGYEGTCIPIVKFHNRHTIPVLDRLVSIIMDE
jgi:hypothetical protein